MFGHMGLHVLKCPSGKYSYVGSVPTALCTEVPATKAAVMGQRAHFNKIGLVVEWKVPVFDTASEAVKFAEERGFEAKVSGE